MDRAQPDVELRLPADRAYVSVLRSLAVGLAVRLDFTLDDLEDLKMAVSEACALLLPEADEGSDLHAEFRLGPDTVVASIGVSATDPRPADVDSWAWQVLSALTTQATETVRDGRFVVTLTLRSSVAPAPAGTAAASETSAPLDP